MRTVRPVETVQAEPPPPQPLPQASGANDLVEYTEFAQELHRHGQGQDEDPEPRRTTSWETRAIEAAAAVEIQAFWRGAQARTAFREQVNTAIAELQQQIADGLASEAWHSPEGLAPSPRPNRRPVEAVVSVEKELEEQIEPVPEPEPEEPEARDQGHLQAREAPRPVEVVTAEQPESEDDFEDDDDQTEDEDFEHLSNVDNDVVSATSASIAAIDEELAAECASLGINQNQLQAIQAIMSGQEPAAVLGAAGATEH